MDATNRHYRTEPLNAETKPHSLNINSVIDDLLDEILLLPTQERPPKLAKIYSNLVTCKTNELPRALERLSMSSFYLSDDDARNR